MLGARPGSAQPLMGSLPSMAVLYVDHRHPSRGAGSYMGAKWPEAAGRLSPVNEGKRTYTTKSGLVASDPLLPFTEQLPNGVT